MVIFTIAKFFQKFCPFFGEKFCTVQKKSCFFTQNIAEKYSMQKLPQNIAKNFTKKINGKHFNLIPQFMSMHLNITRPLSVLAP